MFFTSDATMTLMIARLISRTHKILANLKTSSAHVMALSHILALKISFFLFKIIKGDDVPHI